MVVVLIGCGYGGCGVLYLLYSDGCCIGWLW